MDNYNNYTSNSTTVQTNEKKKCHGNKKLQRFRRRRRDRGMSKEAIEKAIVARTCEKEKLMEKKQDDKYTNRSIQQTTSATTTTIKRKREVSIQGLQEERMPSKSNKKQRRTQCIQSMTANGISVNNDYPPPSYLTQSPHLIFQAIAEHLQWLLNNKINQMFVHIRLQLFDRQFRLDIDRYLWQSYLDVGVQEHIWPKEIHRMVKSEQTRACHTYTIDQLSKIKHQLYQCHEEIKQQMETWSPTETSPALNQLDDYLREYVHTQQNYLLKRIEKELFRYKADIYDQKLYQKIRTVQMTITDQSLFEKLVQVRESQLETYENLVMFKERIHEKFLPLPFDQMEDYVVPSFYWPNIEDRTLVETRIKCRKILQQMKRDILNKYLCAYEFKMDMYQQQYQQILIELEMRLVNSRIRMGEQSLFDTINAYMNVRTDRRKEEIFHKIIHFRQTLVQRRHRAAYTKNSVDVAPRITIDVLHHTFNDEELDYLSQGESYIRPNQSALRPFKHRESQIRKECEDIKKKVVSQLTTYCHRPPPKPMIDRFMELLLTRLRQRFMAPLSYSDQMRAEREQRLTQSIRRKLRKGKLILRVCDKGGGLHVSSRSDYERKVIEYQRETKAYEEITTNPLEHLIANVTKAIKEMRDKKCLSLWRCNLLLPKEDQVKLAYMYFNPKAHKEGTPLRPILNTINTVTRPISDLLDQLIRPIYDEHAKQYTIIDGVNLIRRLEKYATEGHLKESTLFCTFDITNLYTMLPQDESIEILGQFLRCYVGEYVKDISISTIQKLASLVLKENAFVCNNKFYKQVIGGAMGSPFTLTLANIFMWHWEQRWIRRQDQKYEIYGRYIDDVFFTSNESIDIVNQLLADSNRWHPNIKLQANIGKSVPFLDVRVSNEQGALYTSVYHKPSAEPYVLPFLSDHPRYTYANVVQTALVRAIRYSSTYQQFNDERRNVELMLLYNGYPQTFIEKQFRKIFESSVLTTSIHPKVDEAKFSTHRNELMGQLTARQSQADNRIALFKQDDAIAFISNNSIQRKKQSSDGRLILHYTHEDRFHSMKRDIHEVFRQAFADLGIDQLRLIVGHRNSHSIQRELIRKRPPIHLLKKRCKRNKPMTTTIEHHISK